MGSEVSPAFCVNFLWDLQDDIQIKHKGRDLVLGEAGISASFSHPLCKTLLLTEPDITVIS